MVKMEWNITLDAVVERHSNSVAVCVSVCPLRVISKLESQVKQLEHENQARARYSSHSNTQPSGAG